MVTLTRAVTALVTAGIIFGISAVCDSPDPALATGDVSTAGITRILHRDYRWSFTTYSGTFRVRAVIQDMAPRGAVPCKVTVRFTSPGRTQAVYRLASWRFGAIKTHRLSTHISGRGSHRITGTASVSGRCSYFLVY